MPNFTESTFVFKGVTYSRYTADRKRGGADWVFFDSVPVSYTYAVTWAADIQADSSLQSLPFLSHIQEDQIHVDFVDELGVSELAALEALYSAHVAPVPI